MDKCRICLGNKKNLKSIFDRVKDTCYADMMQAIAKVKIPKNTELCNGLCRGCRQKLEEAYEFKLKIERADSAINEQSICKRLQFDNFKDIKIEIEIDTDSKKSIKKEDVTGYFVEGRNEITYCNTLIKKAPSAKEIKDDICLKPVPVLDFLKTIKDEDGDDLLGDDVDLYGISEDNDAAYGYDADSMDGCYESDGSLYAPPNVSKQKSKKKKTTAPGKIKNQPKNGKENKSKGNEVCIKPVNLRGYKLIIEYEKRDKPKKYKRKEVNQMCPHCGRLVKHLNSHILIHIGERNFKCDICGKGFFKKNLLEYHIKKVHAATKDFKCDQCVAAFRCRTALLSHKIKHSSVMKYLCDICNKAFKRKTNWRRHVITHNSANKSVHCSLCNMSFFSPLNLRHNMRIHTGERPYNCEKNTRDAHVITHNSAKKSVHCSLCNMSFFASWHLRHHMRIHTGERPFKCERDVRDRHVRIHNSANKSFQCSLCNMSFFASGHLRHHMRIHTGERPFKCEREAHARHVRAHNFANKTFQCSLCNMSFFLPEKLRHHMRIHTGERPFKCERKARDRHVRAHNSANKSFQCSLCNMSFFLPEKLRHHLRIHTGERPFKCERMARDRHVRAHNSANKSFQCSLCNMSFFLPEKLRHHMRIHTGEQPFKCERMARDRHVRAHNSANKSFQCSLCNMSFFLPENLRHHMRIHTGERPFKCELCSQPYSYKHDFNRHCLKVHGIFLKRRKVPVMNAEVLKREKQIIRLLYLKMHGGIKDDPVVNPFEDEGPGAAMALEMLLKAMENNLVPIDFVS